MATFKVGQGVRVVNLESPFEDLLGGATGVIEGVPRTPESRAQWEWVVEFPRPIGGDRFWKFNSCELAPLTDPLAGEFIAAMEKFAFIASKSPCKQD